MSKDMDFCHSRDILSRIWRNKLLNSVKKEGLDGTETPSKKQQEQH